MSDEKRKIAVEDLYQIKTIEDVRFSPDGQWIAFVRVDVDKGGNTYKRNIWLCAPNGGEPVQLTRSGKESQPRWSADSRTLAFVSSRSEIPQIYLISITAPGGEARQLTQTRNGVSSIAWSPDGSQIAFLSPMNHDERLDEDNGETEPPPQDDLERRYRADRRKADDKKRLDPRVVRKIPYRTGTSYLTDRFRQVYVVPVAEGLGDEGKPRRLTDYDGDHQAPEWTVDGEYVITGRVTDPEIDEAFRHNCLYRIRVDDGQIDKLTHDDDTAFGPLPSHNARWILYRRLPREDMSLIVDRLTVIPMNGGEGRDLNRDFDRSASHYRWSAAGDVVFSARSQGCAAIYRVSPEGGPVQPLVKGDMLAEIFDVGPNGEIAFVASSAAQPDELFLSLSDENGFKQLTYFNKPLLDEVIVQPTHHLPFTSEGHQVDGWYILPPDYVEGQTYPLALHIHGGPHVMWGPHQGSMWHQWQYLAAQGYVVFFTNPRGSSGYGEAFRKMLRAAWGSVAFADIMAGVDALLEKGFVDSDRLAVTGGSYGGYMTTWIVSHTDRFIAAVSQRGVYNLLSFYGTSDIPGFVKNEFGDTPLSNPQFIWEHSPLAHAHKIKTPTLVLHSETDFRVPVSEGEQMFAYLRRNGVETEFVVYPREGHELSRSGEPEHRIDRLSRILNWFDRYCKPQSETGE